MGNRVLGLLVMVCLGASFVTVADPTKIVGPDECAECHDVETSIWEETHHFNTFETMPESDEGVAISERLGIDDPIEAPLCRTCHLTVMGEGDDAEVIAGVSCESCHGAGADWIEVHSEEDKPADQAASIWAESEAAGMIRPGNVHGLAENCLTCHIVPQEDLVNVGQHPAGSEFELVTFSQGEVRHNTYNSEDNRPASVEKQRLMLAVGVIVEAEQALRALAGAKDAAGDYATSMVERFQAARLRLGDYAQATGQGDLVAAAEAASSDPVAGDQNLLATADTLMKHASALASTSADLASLDPFLDQLGEPKGDVYEM